MLFTLFYFFYLCHFFLIVYFSFQDHYTMSFRLFCGLCQSAYLYHFFLHPLFMTSVSKFNLMCGLAGNNPTWLSVQLLTFQTVQHIAGV